MIAHLAYLAAAWLLLAGLWGVCTSRHLVHLVACLGVAQSSTYLLLLAIGYRADAQAPIRRAADDAAATVDPVVQALTLTDVVVGATVAALLLALAVRVHDRTGTLDPDRLRPLRQP